MTTTVRNPMHRLGYPQFKYCSGCHGKFTALGLSRHWDHCKFVLPSLEQAKAEAEHTGRKKETKR